MDGILATEGDVLKAIRANCDTFQRAAEAAHRNLHDLCAPVPATLEVLNLIEKAKVALPFYTDYTVDPVHPLLSHIFSPDASLLMREIDFVVWRSLRESEDVLPLDHVISALEDLDFSFNGLLGLIESCGEKVSTGEVKERFTHLIDTLKNVQYEPKDPDFVTQDENDFFGGICTATQNAFIKFGNALKGLSSDLAKVEDHVVQKRRDSRKDMGPFHVEYFLNTKDDGHYRVHLFNDGKRTLNYKEPDASYKTFSTVKNAERYYNRCAFERDHAKVEPEGIKSELAKRVLKAAAEIRKECKALSEAADYYCRFTRRLFHRKLHPGVDPDSAPYLKPLRFIIGSLIAPDFTTEDFRSAYELLGGATTDALDFVVKPIPSNDPSYVSVQRLIDAWSEFQGQFYQFMRYGVSGNGMDRVYTAWGKFTELLPAAHASVKDFEKRFAARKVNPEGGQVAAQGMDEVREILKKVCSGVETVNENLKEQMKVTQNMNRKADIAHKQLREHIRNVDEDRPVREYKKPKATTAILEKGIEILTKDHDHISVRGAAKQAILWAEKQKITPPTKHYGDDFKKRIDSMGTRLGRVWKTVKKPDDTPQD